MDYIQRYVSPLGNITIASDGNALIGLWFENQKYYKDTLSKNHQETSLPIFDITNKWLDIYFSGQIPDFTPQLLLRTTPFRKEVANIMLNIPYGKTTTYKEIASIIAKTKGLEQMSSQAVGGAVGHNPISLIIPCHRVIGSNGNLTGYAGGLDIKAKLLELEKINI